ncbi:MAG TPA: preprotein translocase subunit SecG [Steroidobacteraceae bacterium]|nr:preprotein translocase subunit SecG [Steroidobacteraceae bacterium]
MNWVHTVAVVIHVLLAAGIIGLVLLQRGRGADAGAGFGAGASGTVFGARGSASFLSRMTATLATLFFVTSLALAYLGSQRSAPVSILDTAPATSTPSTIELPAMPSETPPAAIETEPAPTVDTPMPVEGSPAAAGEAAPAATDTEAPEPAN